MTNWLLYIILFLLGISSMTYSQNIGFRYDEAGNNITREVIVLSKSPKGKAATYVESVRMSKKNIHIIGRGDKLRIEVLGHDATDNLACSIYNYSGHEIISVHPKSSPVDLYTGALPTGVYILYVSLNGEKMSRKIIKR